MGYSSRVSIIIPTFNQNPAYLRAALLSARHQTHCCEIVVVDDGSEPRQDGVVEEILLGYSNEQTRAVYIWQPNTGVAGALNKGLELATGEWVQWLPSDDLFDLRKTEVFLSCADAHPEFRVWYCAYEEGIPSSTRLLPAPTYSAQASLFDALRRHCFINAATVMWHRSVFETVGKFNTNMTHAQDYEFLLRCAEQYNFAGISDALVRRRIHPGQMLNTLRDPQEANKKHQDMSYIRERYGADGNVWLPALEKA